jgi:hypothetical protein
MERLFTRSWSMRHNGFDPSLVSRQRAFEQLSQFERISRGFGDAAPHLEELRTLALVFDLNPADLSFVELWRALRPMLLETSRLQGALEV